MRIIAACALVLMLASSVQAADVDWKFYGGASIAGPSSCFYDANTVAHTSSGYVRVWTKCLAQKDLVGERAKSDIDKITGNAIRKAREGYVPPIIVFGKMEFDKALDVALYEEVANLVAIEPQAEIFEELNCSERMMRSLSVSLHVNGQSRFENKSGDWNYVAPEGNAATLLKILCPKQ